MKRPLAYITAAWCGEDYKKHGTGGPVLPSGVRGWVFAHLPYAVSALFLNDAVPEEHKTAST